MSRAKRQSFAAKAKHRRKVAAITKQHRHTPGFMGVVRGLVITTPAGKKTTMGYGAMIWSRAPSIQVA